MSVEVLALVATVVFGLAGVAAAYYGYRALEASSEQLALAREQAAQVPSIELMEVSMRPLREDAELFGWVHGTCQEQIELRRRREEEERRRQERKQAREEHQRREHERRERQEKRRGGFNADTVDEMEKTELLDWFKPMADPPWMNELASTPEPLPMPELSLTPTRYVYEGPLPDYFVDVGIRNVGRAAAYDVTGWVWFDMEVIEPVEYFAASGVKVRGEANGKVKVELSVRNEGGRLFPSHNDPYTFRIPVRLHRVADTSFEFEFTSPQGAPARGSFKLQLVSGGTQEVAER